jgi:hypothetical protein
MKLWEYAGFTTDEAKRLPPQWHVPLPEDSPIPAAKIDLAPGAKRPSMDDLDELRKFAAFLRLKL